MSYKIQCKTIFGWIDVLGTFPDIESAREKIPQMEEKLFDQILKTTLVLRIVESNVLAINENFVYSINET